jgi:hypothetical protein
LKPWYELGSTKPSLQQNERMDCSAALAMTMMG